ncbi:MAG TPA: 2-oxoacid:acceptor oxidoreductase family protein [Candidatus Atribacteria bacterium]|nr:2-oxoacid:acceptor oxidoreductase family protein [Candidatus Atribacteria bacterium]
MHHEILIGGFGGQGILFLGRVLATAGMIEGYEVSWFPSYGPEMRGGTASCTVIISEEEIGATVTDHPDICIVMNEPSFRRFSPLVRRGGLLVVNSSLIRENCSRRDIEILQVPANELAGKEVGVAETTNMVILGALIARQPVVSFSAVKKALEKILVGKKANLLSVNFKALEVGKSFEEKGGVVNVSERPDE